MTPPQGPVGENTVVLCCKCGKIKKSQLPAFKVGNTIYDYAHPKFHFQIRVILGNLIYIRRQPVVFEFENLFKGRYYPRRARIYYNYEEEGALCFVEDAHRPTNIIPYADLFGPTYNEFLVSPAGKVLECKYPEKTIPKGGPVGMNVFATLFPEYIKPVRMTINKVLAKEIELPIEYTFSVKGEIRHKVGTIKPQGDNVLFCVRRIAKAQKKIYNCRCG